LKTAFLFPGQGSQCVGMGRDLFTTYPACQSLFHEADRVLGLELSHLAFHGPGEKLMLTEYAQPAILMVSIALERLLRAGGIVPDFVAGHSLGEYSALVAAGAIGLADALRTVRRRGEYMQEAVPVGVGAMAAILGLDLPAIEDACREAAAGEVVSPPDLAALAFRDPEVPLVSNVDARVVREGDACRDGLVRQVSGAVRWQESVELLAREGVDVFVEVGPGTVLSGLVRKIAKGARVLNVDSPESLEAAVAALGAGAEG
jgi:[acyl-carrier-protein] S-malonyltransferase